MATPFLCLLLAGTASASPVPPAENSTLPLTSTSTLTAPPTQSERPSSGSHLDVLQDQESVASGIAIGFDDGVYGDGMISSVRLKVPFEFLGLGNFGATIGGVFLMHGGTADSDPRSFAGGRLYLFGQSNVLPNLLRLYGGFGVQVAQALTEPKDLQLFPYGQDGIEFFLAPSLSFYVEIGLTPYVQEDRFTLLGVAVFGVNFYLTDPH